MLETETCRRRLRRTRSGRWSSWSSWCSGRTGSSWWWISAAVSSWPPSTCGPDLHSGEGRLPGLTPAPPAGWEVARLSCWTSVVGVMEGCQRKKLREMGWKRLDGEIVCWNIFMACEWKSFPEKLKQLMCHFIGGTVKVWALLHDRQHYPTNWLGWNLWKFLS